MSSHQEVIVDEGLRIPFTLEQSSDALSSVAGPQNFEGSRVEAQDVPYEPPLCRIQQIAFLSEQGGQTGASPFIQPTIARDRERHVARVVWNPFVLQEGQEIWIGDCVEAVALTAM